MANSTDYNYACRKCPRTFKLQEFYEKHQKVHQLKKQHVCTICGFVYGAAKGLEGHMETAHGPKTDSSAPPPPTDTGAQAKQEIPFGMGFHFLQSQGVLATANLSQDNATLLQKAMLAQLASSAGGGISFPLLTGSQASTGSASESASNTESLSPSVSPPVAHSKSCKEDKSKIPSPAGTGNYKIYDSVPQIHDATDAQQNDSGFFRCTICTREFSGLNSLKKHVPIHTRRVQHKCDTCGYVFGKKEYLLDHMRKHTGEISPVCEVCGQTFNKSLKLKEHQKLHRNVSSEGTVNEYIPYRCHICKQCFSRPEPLGEHLRSQHSETVYKCDMCDATFGDVRGKNHHMYNEHQLDAFHQKCVWCPVCNQGFTRHYNLKVHMYKSHGKEYLENNFSSEELEALMRPPPGSNTSKPAPSPRKLKEDEVVIPGAPTGVLPISPPLTPKLSPKQKPNSGDSPTMVPTSSVIPSASILKANLERTKTRPGPASLTKPQHYFDQEAQHSMLKCQICEDKFLRQSDLYIHLEQHGVNVFNCQLCEDKFLEVADLRRHVNSVHAQSEGSHQQTKTRRPGPASKTNAPRENRAYPPPTSNLPSHLAAQYQDDRNGFPCKQCGKVLMHKQSYVSHMRVIHGDYYGGNKWKGSSVVEMILGENSNGSVAQEEMRAQLTAALNNISNNVHRGPEANGELDLTKFAYNCEFCAKTFPDRAALYGHIHTKHPNLTKRIQAFKEALGLNDSDEPDTKRIKLDYKGILKDQNENSLSSLSIISPSVAHAHLPSGDYDEPLNLACKPVSVSIDEENKVDRLTYSDDFNNNNNLLAVAQVAQPCPSPPCSPLNLHISRPATPSPTPSPPSPEIPQVSNVPSPKPVTPTSAQTAITGDTPKKVMATTPKLHEYLVKQNNATSDENGRKKFLCPVCKCQLSWKTNLAVHLRTHSGERPFQCVLCLNRFRQKAHLYKHFRCSHGHKVAPFKCMFCSESYTRSPNDLYNHITEAHKKETDELQANNKTQEIAAQQQQDQQVTKSDDEEVDVTDNIQVNQEPTEELSEEIQEKQEEEKQVRDRDDDVRYEPISEEFMFEGELISPCYCVLPFVTDDEVESITRRNIAEYYEKPEEYSDEEGEMVIDENPPDELKSSNLPSNNNTSITTNNNILGNGLQLKINNFGLGIGIANEHNICNKKNDVFSPQDIKLPTDQPVFYPAFPDFSLPFSLSGLIQKKKAEMAAILAPRMVGVENQKPKHEAPTKTSKAMSPSKDSANNNSAVSDYENQIQNDFWPLDCIKCNTLLSNLDNFNIHMNDHWSDDKCCPVCGLLINSKRFNFKQHLKIHTGEKPFVCHVCNRAFRQKAHMVKHVTTHRSEPRNGHDTLAFQAGVIVQ